MNQVHILMIVIGLIGLQTLRYDYVYKSFELVGQKSWLSTGVFFRCWRAVIDLSRHK